MTNLHPTLLSRALDADDLDDACRLIQDALGITDGDIAGQCLSEYAEKWATMTRQVRQRVLADWLRTETLFA
ncbi:MAG TPA: hypothetical protein VKE42_06140 [Candidatus Cybelea sp.]|nr:hypothetical protein [Candidatus Cybelea sp.]